MKQTVIYEVRLEIDPEIEQEFDAWLIDHIAEMLCFDGFMSADVLVPDSPPDSRPAPALAPEGLTRGSPPTPTLPPEGAGARLTRQVQYQLASREELEHYFSEHAHRMRQQAVERFGSRFSATRAVYDLGIQPVRLCQNCNATLRGQYCEVCGQRDKHRIISLWELLRDLVGDLFEFDSRVWRSLRPLLFKPGRLTTEYLRGRRVHYTPPLRLYLITSLLFFLVVFFNTDDVTFDGPTEAGDIAEMMEAMGADPSDIAEAMVEMDVDPSEVAEAMAASDADPNDIAKVMAAMENLPVDDGDKPIDDPESGSATGPESDAGTRTLADRCEKVNIQGTAWDDAIEQRAKKACRKLAAEGGAARFLSDLIDNAPGMMFVFLPVIALVMTFLYPFSRRYYVEHLLFFVHFHSFFFLLLTLTVLFARLPEVLPGQALASKALDFVVFFYIPIYLFVAMRRVYGQSTTVTAVKYGALGIAYFISLLLSFTAMAFFTALSV